MVLVQRRFHFGSHCVSGEGSSLKHVLGHKLPDWICITHHLHRRRLRALCHYPHCLWPDAHPSHSPEMEVVPLGLQLAVLETQCRVQMTYADVQGQVLTILAETH